MYVIGTSGHVDHGKSSLVKALTGMDPDRLAEEKFRGMTIDLGYAWLRLPSGKEISIIDVPGHQQFIENMLAGVGAIDAAILVVAADDGVMPQTREHLAILDLLQISKGVVALTKIDMVEQSLQHLAIEEVRSLVDATALKGSAIIPLSSITGEGLREFAAALDVVLGATPSRSNLERPRLWIDRIFSCPGFGTIVAGTLIDGILHVGQEVEILPRKICSRIRRMETHKRSIEVATPGMRVAVNLPRLDVNDLQRGNILTTPGSLCPTKRLDVRLHCWHGTDEILSDSVTGRFFAGSFSCGAKVRLLDRDLLLPGETAYAQLFLDSEAAVARWDHFIFRRPALCATSGGGIILDTHPQHHKRKNAAVLKNLAKIESGNPKKIVESILSDKLPISVAHLAEWTALPLGKLNTSLLELLESGKVIVLAVDPSRLKDAYVASRSGWKKLLKQLQKQLQSYHRKYRLRPGMPKEECRSQLQLAEDLFRLIIHKAANDGCIKDLGRAISLAGFSARLTQQQTRKVNRLLKAYHDSPYMPPTGSEARKAHAIDVELFQAVLFRGDMVDIGDDIFFAADIYQDMVTRVVEYLGDCGTISVAQARDLFGSTRRYMVAFLEHLDQRITRRLGDEHVLRNPRPQAASRA